jgi:hypothetical protein
MLVGAVFLVGCASSTEWVHPRKPKEAFTQDYARCENTMMDDPKVQAATASGSKFMLQVAIEKCLHTEGWMQVEQPN